jgi:transcriptional regulator with XRE-family HTH domain
MLSRVSDEHTYRPLAHPQSSGEFFGWRVKAVRERHGWTQDELSRRLAEVGRPTDRAVIARIESGGRRARNASFEEVLAFAAALGVSPLALLIPTLGVLEIAPKIALPVELARAWITGDAPLRPEDREIYGSFLPHLGARGRRLREDVEELLKGDARQLQRKEARALLRAFLEEERQRFEDRRRDLPDWVSDQGTLELALGDADKNLRMVDTVLEVVDKLDEKFEKEEQ